MEDSSFDAQSIAGSLAAVLRENHARVLDFFRKVDTNFDGCISRGEMSYALHALGLNASPKEVEALFNALDPSGDGIVEYSELQDALLHGLQAPGAVPPTVLVTSAMLPDAGSAQSGQTHGNFVKVKASPSDRSASCFPFGTSARSRQPSRARRTPRRRLVPVLRINSNFR